MIAIRDVRKSQGMTQECLAQKIGVGQNTISQWENGLRNPNLETIRKLAEILHCTTDDILRGELKPPEK